MDARYVPGSATPRMRKSDKRPTDTPRAARYLMSRRSGELDGPNSPTMAANSEAILGHSFAVGSIPAFDAVGNTMSACGHGSSARCHKCGG